MCVCDMGNRKTCYSYYIYCLTQSDKDKPLCLGFLNYEWTRDNADGREN